MSSKTYEVTTESSKRFNRIREMAQEKGVGFTPGKKLEVQRKKDKKIGPVKSWSFSRLKDFEDCRYRVYLSVVEKTPRPPQGAPLLRGIRIHDEAEKYVKGEGPLTDGLQRFETSLNALRTAYGEGVAEIEEDWGFTKEWESVPWKYSTVWLRMKLDAFVKVGDDSCRVIDYKTGKKFGNEIKHTDQGITYAIGAMMKYPELQAFQVEFWYLDKGEVLEKTFLRSQLQLLLPTLEDRAYALTTCVEFDPSPSINNCRWCPHRETDTCAYAEAQ